MPGRTNRRKFRLHWAGLLPALVLAFAVLVPPLRAAEPVFPPGSRVGLTPPAGLVVSPDFTGFMNSEAGTSILINTMTREAFGEMVSAMTADKLATRNMTLLGPCDNVSMAFESHCIRASQVAGGYLVQKWILIAKLESETAIVVVTMPDVVMTQGIYSAAEMEVALSSLAYDQALVASPIDALPFTIEEGELLSFQRALGGSAAAYAAPATDGAPQPLWIVAASLEQRTQARELTFSRTAFRQIRNMSGHRITDERPFTMEQLDGHIIEGTAKDEKTGADLYVFQALLVDPSNKYYRLIGLVPAGQKAVYRPEFLRLMQTLRPR